MKILSSRRGFTLIEIVVFIIVLGIVLGVLAPFTVGMQGSPNAVVTQQALALAQGELEQTIAIRRAPALGFGFVVSGPPCYLTMPAGFTCAREVCYVPEVNPNDTSNCGGVTNYRRVQVTITHAAIGNVTAVTLVTNYP